MNTEIKSIVRDISSIVDHVQYPLALKALATVAADLILSNGGLRGNGYLVFCDSLDLAMADLISHRK